MISVTERIAKHTRIISKSMLANTSAGPSFLVLFINSICNMQCEHCFYWKELNQKTDLTYDELAALSKDLGHLETLNLSGGEPFLRKDFAEICKLFIRNNGVKEIYVPTNAYFTDRTIKALKELLKEDSLKEIGVEISLDGMPAFHDEFRKTRYSFYKAMETYDALAELQKTDSRLQIYCISTATEDSLGELKKLTTYLYDRCPQMTHHYVTLIRGDRKNPTLQGPHMQQYKELYDYVAKLWAPRDQARIGSIVEPMLQYVKTRSAEEERQVVPCQAGILNAVVHANGDVGVCEQRKPLGNLREKSFKQLWQEEATNKVRESIKRKDCHCTNAIPMWPSIVFQPVHLIKSFVAAKAWQKPDALDVTEKPDYTADIEKMEIPKSKLKETFDINEAAAAAEKVQAGN